MEIDEITQIVGRFVYVFIALMSMFVGNVASIVFFNTGMSLQQSATYGMIFNVIGVAVLLRLIKNLNNNKQNKWKNKCET